MNLTVRFSDGESIFVELSSEWMTLQNYLILYNYLRRPFHIISYRSSSCRNAIDKITIRTGIRWIPHPSKDNQVTIWLSFINISTIYQDKNLCSTYIPQYYVRCIRRYILRKSFYLIEVFLFELYAYRDQMGL